MAPRFARFVAMTFLIGLAFVPAAHASPQWSVHVGIGAPVAVPPVVPVARAGYVWQPGYYVRTRFGIEWVPGAWVPDPYGYRYHDRGWIRGDRYRYGGWNRGDRDRDRDWNRDHDRRRDWSR